MFHYLLSYLFALLFLVMSVQSKGIHWGTDDYYDDETLPGLSTEAKVGIAVGVVLVAIVVVLVLIIIFEKRRNSTPNSESFNSNPSWISRLFRHKNNGNEDTDVERSSTDTTARLTSTQEQKVSQAPTNVAVTCSAP